MAKMLADTVHHLHIRGHTTSTSSAYIDTTWGLGTDTVWIYPTDKPYRSEQSQRI